MKLEELDAELRKRAPREVTVIDRTPPPENPITTAARILEDRRRSYAEPQHGLQIVRREPQEMLPVSVVIVEDETGCIQYMRRDPDGHIGALDT